MKDRRQRSFRCRGNNASIPFAMICDTGEKVGKPSQWIKTVHFRWRL
jgi:hypothetical protein